MLVALFTLGLLGLAPWLISNHRLASNNTPTVASWPVFGSILPFATRGASFIHVCRLKVRRQPAIQVKPRLSAGQPCQPGLVEPVDTRACALGAQIEGVNLLQ